MARKKNFATPSTLVEKFIDTIPEPDLTEAVANGTTVGQITPAVPTLDDATRLAIRNSQFLLLRMQENAQKVQQSIQQQYERAIQDQNAVLQAAYDSVGLKPEDWSLDADTLSFVPAAQATSPVSK